MLTDGAFRLPYGLGGVGVHRFDTAKLLRLYSNDFIVFGEFPLTKNTHQNIMFQRVKNCFGIGLIGAKLGKMYYFVGFPFKTALNLSSNSAVFPLLVGLLISFFFMPRFFAHCSNHSAG